jgi:hypothetical protein
MVVGEGEAELELDPVEFRARETGRDVAHA